MVILYFPWRCLYAKKGIRASLSEDLFSVKYQLLPFWQVVRFFFSNTTSRNRSLSVNMLILVTFMCVKNLFKHYAIVQKTLVPMSLILTALLEEPLCSQTDWHMHRGQLWSGKSNSGSLLVMMMLLCSTWLFFPCVLFQPVTNLALHQEPNIDLTFWHRADMIVMEN